MNNTIKTIFLLGVLSIFLILVGNIVGGQEGLYFAFILSLILNGVAYFFSDKIALASCGAKPIAKDDMPKLHRMIEELSYKAKIPLPKLYLTPSNQANAFATGRSPQHASVAVTKGLLQELSDDEVKAVLAHEISHIKNRDILIASVAAVLASSIAFLSRMALYGGYGRRDRHGAGGLVVLLALFGPLAAMLIQFAISRQREFAADSKGAKLIGSGEPLAKALSAINQSTRRLPMVNMNPAFSSLYIGNPFGGLGGGLLNLFSTHPPVEERIKRLTQA